MSSRLRLAASRALPHVLLAGVLIAAAFLVREWAYATTYRLYLVQRVDAATSSTATQRFDLEGGRVVPLIAMHDDRVSFRAAINRAATVRAQVRPQGAARYEIRTRTLDGVVRVCAGGASAPVSVACPFPTGTGVIDVVAYGDVTWSDLRIERHLLAAPAVAIALLAASIGVLWIGRFWRITPRARRAWGAVMTALTIAGITTAGLEAALRLVGAAVSPPIGAARHDLGEITADPRWQRSAAFGQRLSANFDGTNFWRQGDIVRMGFLSPALSEGVTHRFPLHTDAEGFRNPVTRDRIDVAALGDSFTDALTLPVEQGWPMQLEARLGVAVQNYGTAGFGPQQELLALREYAARHRPRVVVLAFFAGNDLRDAEVFEAVGRTDVAIGHPQLGWPIKDVISRADTWYLVNAIHAASAVLVSAPVVEEPVLTPATANPVDRPSFDRGLFALPVNGRVVRWAFMPPYLNMLNFSETDLSGRRGWTLVRENVSEMKRVAEQSGARFVVMFLPSKSQVYLPLLARSFEKRTLTAALNFSLRQMGGDADPDRLMANRLALNGLMRRFCEGADVPFLDMTGLLEAALETGENVYFPDDSHLNEVGQAVVADALAGFLHVAAPELLAANRGGQPTSAVVARQR